MVAIPLFYRHGQETKLPIYLFWPTSAVRVFRRIGMVPVAFLLQLWVLCESGMAHDTAFKEQEHKAAPKQQH